MSAHEPAVANPAHTSVSTHMPSNCAGFDSPECSAAAYSSLRMRTAITPMARPRSAARNGIQRVVRAM